MSEGQTICEMDYIDNYNFEPLKIWCLDQRG